MTEEWRDVVGYEGLYEVSSRGRVRSVARTIVVTNELCGTHTRHLRSIIRKLRDNKDGYKIVGLWNPSMVTRPVHGLVAEAFIGPRPEGMQIRHLNGVKDDNQVSNLRWGTGVENTQDKRDHGTMRIGEKHARSKLTDEQVVDIRKAYAAGRGLSDLGRQYGYSPAGIQAIVRREVWKHVD